MRIKRITGFLPHDLNLYRTALMHKSMGQHTHTDKNTAEDAAKEMETHRRPVVNNERLEYLGDAVLGAVVADILYKHYPKRQEGFLTTLRSKLVSREALNRLAVKIGLDKLVLHEGPVTSAHNSYVNGNAFEAFFGALYLDRGYRACMSFMRDIVFVQHVNIEEAAKKDENYKSKLIEWCQKYQLKINFEIISQKILPDRTTPKFVSRVTIEDQYCGNGEGYSKKESHQQAARQAYQKVKRDVSHVNRLIEARNKRVAQQ